MTSSLARRALSLCLAVLDCGLVLATAALGALVVVAVRLALNPQPEIQVADGTALVMAATVLAVLVYRRVVRKLSWMQPKGRFIFGLVALLVLSGITLVVVRTLVEEMVRTSGTSGGIGMAMVQGSVFLLLCMGFFMLRRFAEERGWINARTRVAWVVCLVLFQVYLVHDEVAAPSVARNHAVMAGRYEDRETYLLTLRYSPGVQGAKVFTPPSRKVEFNHKPEKLGAYLQAHRDDLVANWNELAEVRAWWAEMAARPELGDQVAMSFEQPVIRFAPVRVYSQHALALAALRAIDGDGDGALAMAGDVYVVAMRLEPASCTLLREMVAISVQRQVMETAEFILNQAPVSSEARVRFANLLSERKGGAAGARRLVLMDVVNFFGTPEAMSQLKAGVVGPAAKESGPMRFVHALMARVYFNTLNPQATSNRLHDLYEKRAICAEARDLAGLKRLDENLGADQFAGFPVKNISGRLLVQMASPAFSVIVKSFWETEDRQEVLIKKLRESPPKI